MNPPEPLLGTAKNWPEPPRNTQNHPRTISIRDSPRTALEPPRTGQNHLETPRTIPEPPRTICGPPRTSQNHPWTYHSLKHAHTFFLCCCLPAGLQRPLSLRPGAELQPEPQPPPVLSCSSAVQNFSGSPAPVLTGPTSHGAARRCCCFSFFSLCMNMDVGTADELAVCRRV